MKKGRDSSFGRVSVKKGRDSSVVPLVKVGRDNSVVASVKVERDSSVSVALTGIFFFPPESDFGTPAYDVVTDPVCYRMHRHPLFRRHTKIQHTLVGVSGAYRVRRPEFPARDNEVSKKTQRRAR